MPSFGHGSWWDLVTIISLIVFLILSRRMRMPGGLAVGISFFVAGVLAVLSGRVAFRHYSVYTGVPARTIGGFYIAVGLWFMTMEAKKRKTTTNQDPAEK